MHEYFSDREQGSRARVEEEITDAPWGGIAAEVRSRVQDGSFGSRYPRICLDGEGVAGTDLDAFVQALRGVIPQVDWPLPASPLPDTPTVLDIVEFCYGAVAEPIRLSYHPYYSHHHLDFDRESGRSTFRAQINNILGRNGLVYDLQENGSIIRLAPEGLREELMRTVFASGDKELDMILESARHKFLSPELDVRKEALEKLWDAWERLKTLLDPDKRRGIQQLLNQAADEPNFRELLESEARSLTDVGNNFMIRHSERDKIPLANSEQVDYFFHRMFSLIRLLLRSSGRGG